MKKVLVVDDEKPISDIIKFNLVKGGYNAYTAYDGGEALERVIEVKPGLVLFDLMLPKIDGLEVAREVRKTYDMPIITVTVKDSEIDKVLDLELGADDYVAKPSSNRKLVTCAKANLHRDTTAARESEEAIPTELTIGDLTIHPRAYTVIERREVVKLTHREFELPFYLAEHLGQVITREYLL